MAPVRSNFQPVGRRVLLTESEGYEPCLLSDAVPQFFVPFKLTWSVTTMEWGRYIPPAPCHIPVVQQPTSPVRLTMSGSAVKFVLKIMQKITLIDIALFIEFLNYLKYIHTHFLEHVTLFKFQ